MAEWALPSWWARYANCEGSWSSLDNATMVFLAAAFNSPTCFLVPVDLPRAAVHPSSSSTSLGGPLLLLPAVPLPQARALERPVLSEAPLSTEGVEQNLAVAAAGRIDRAEGFQLSTWNPHTAGELFCSASPAMTATNPPTCCRCDCCPSCRHGVHWRQGAGQDARV